MTAMSQKAADAASAAVSVDHGATGQAQMSRLSRTVEAIAAGVTAKQMIVWPPDAMLEAGIISRKQHDAATYLREVACMANRYMVWPEGFGRGAAGTLADDEPPTEAEQDYYRRCADDYRTIGMAIHPILWRHVRAAVMPEHGGYWEPKWVEKALGWLAAYWRFR